MGDHHDKREVEFEGLMQRDQAVQYLESLIETIREGVLHIEAEGRSVTLHPSDTISLKVEGSSKDDKEKFSIRLSWRKLANVDGDPGLRISATEPEPAEDEEEEAEEPAFTQQGENE